MKLVKYALLSSLFVSLIACDETARQKETHHQPDLTAYFTSTNLNTLTQESFYVPVYSEIYSSTEKMSIQLTVTLSIRNTSTTQNTFIKSVDYYNSKGEKIRNYLSKPIELKPLQAIDFVVTEADKTGGTGANFIVQTASNGNAPLLQGVMIGTLNQQGISYSTQAIKTQ